MSDRPNCLDLFCGAGGAAMGLYRAGFDVTGVDIVPQPRYPFRFIRADALRPPVRLEDFDLIWASPPCQGYSRTRHLPWLMGKRHPLLIEPVRALLERHPATVIENVEDSPLTGIELRGEMFGLHYRRLRRFETSFMVMAPPRASRAAGSPGRMFGGRLRKQHGMLTVGNGQSIPPEYSEWIGRYAMIALGRAVA